MFVSEEDRLYDYHCVIQNADDLYDENYYDDYVDEEKENVKEFKYSYCNMLEELDCTQTL
jgi:hypothetical protein